MLSAQRVYGSQCRTRASHEGRHDPTDWVEIPASTPEPIELAVLREALGLLSPDQRAVVALHPYAGYSVLASDSLNRCGLIGPPGPASDRPSQAGLNT